MSEDARTPPPRLWGGEGRGEYLVFQFCLHFISNWLDTIDERCSWSLLPWPRIWDSHCWRCRQSIWSILRSSPCQRHATVSPSREAQCWSCTDLQHDVSTRMYLGYCGLAHSTQQGTVSTGLRKEPTPHLPANRSANHIFDGTGLKQHLCDATSCEAKQCCFVCGPRSNWEHLSQSSKTRVGPEEPIYRSALQRHIEMTKARPKFAFTLLSCTLSRQGLTLPLHQHSLSTTKG